MDNQYQKRMKKIYIILLILLTTTMCKQKEEGTTVLIQTNLGDIKVMLYDDTPLHRDNFVKLANEGFFDNKIFHRVVKDFMVQAGEEKNMPADSAAQANDRFNDTIPAEFCLPKYYHKRGALAAARWGDMENPTKASSGHQFYIVTGQNVFDIDFKEIEKQRFERLKQSIHNKMQSESKDTIKNFYKEGNKSGLTEFRNNMITQSEKEAERRKTEILFTDEQKKIYKEIGGTPFLDGEYTVFGEVVDGMDIVSKIEAADVNEKDKPKKDIIIIKARVLN